MIVDLGVLVTALVLGLRHGIDWDHIAAISDITSTTAAGDLAVDTHAARHTLSADHDHPHGGPDEMRVHAITASGIGPGAMLVGAAVLRDVTRRGGMAGFLREHWHPIALGTLYAVGHASVVIALGLAALLLGASLPEWVDPIMSRIVGLTLVVLGAYVLVSLFAYLRSGGEIRLRSRWMLVFDGARHGWWWLQARIHGHEHDDPLEASSYGPRTALAVGMIHGIGAETASQVLLIAAIGGAAGAGLGVPMLVAFVAGLLISNTAIVFLSASGFVAARGRTPLYFVVGLVAGLFSLILGMAFLLGADGSLPDIQRFVGIIG